MTDRQRRTLEELVSPGRWADPTAPSAVDGVVRDLDRRLEGAGFGAGVDRLWIGKHLLNDLDRCEGLFREDLSRPRAAFEHTAPTGAGSVFHKAIELDVITERGMDPRTMGEHAAERLCRDEPAFARFWAGLDELERAEVLAESGRRVDTFRASFPPLPRAWAPQPELRLRAELAGGSVALTGKPDLALGRGRRLLIDLKTGGAWPEHAEDVRFYALLFLLRTTVLPFRVATFFLESGEWQGEDVTTSTVARAADRVVSAAEAASRLRAGSPATLRPGRHCSWCPARRTCAAADGSAP